MNERFTYTDRAGEDLLIERSNIRQDEVFLITEGAFVPAVDLPKIFAELRKAAGVPVPVEHEHEDDEGQALSIVSSEYRPNTAFVEGCNGAYVTPEDLPGLVRKLYEAAGQEPPILLPRPSAEDLRAHGWIDGDRVNPAAIHAVGTTTPGVARGFAACLAASADVAEAEPTPEQVKQLADVIGKGRVLGSAANAIAREVLAAGYAKATP
ncbi:hypothetical protein [Nonomuraea sp. NPDC049750]|uniref:hypothetical protein n=1 Tax=Nonomuraea sp. NPDC049750 TaxID=3154738 RepID=UPI0033D3C3C9